MTVYAMKATIPWWAKIAAKVLLSRLPLNYAAWRQLGLFRHGHMEHAEYATHVFTTHFSRCWPSQVPREFVCAEIGPGDSLSSALIARAYGARKTYLVDAGAFASEDMRQYRALATHLADRGLGPAMTSAWGSVKDMLAACNAEYLTRGRSSLASIPSASIDFIWSQAVLEHIRKSEFRNYMHELRRILKPGGKASHRVDLRDHLGGALNNLRFDERTWEKEWFAKSGFYTNRIRFLAMCHYFRETGFNVEILNVDRWDVLPTPRRKLSTSFQELTDEELLVQGFDVVLTVQN